MIGDKNYWGRGIAADTISLISNYAFDELHLRKVFAGVYGNNIGSIKALKNVDLKKHMLKRILIFLMENTLMLMFLSYIIKFS